MKAVRTACARGDFRPRTSALCSYCSFQEFCPAYGGDPDAGRAGDARAPGRPRRPAAAPARHRLSRRGSRSMRAEIARFDAAVDRAVDRVRSPAVDGVVYRLSSAADHSLLWHICGAAVALARGGDVAVRGAVRRRDGRRVAAHQRRGQDRCSGGSARPSTPTSSSTTACTARSRARSRRGTRPPRSARRRCSAAGPAGTRSPPAVAATRVYVRLHHASDVAAGAAFGLALGRRVPPLRALAAARARTGAPMVE